MKAIRLHLKQNSANYRREETVNCRMTYPLPPYSTVIGALHKACGYTSYHPMQVSIQGKYGSLKQRMFKEDCFLNSLQDDRGILVKMVSNDVLCSAYNVVAIAQKAQGNSFEKGITINVVNQTLLNEYRALNKLNKRITAHKQLIKAKKDTLKAMKSNADFSEDEIKTFADKVKALEKAYKQYENIKYTKPKAKFRTLTKAPKWYELLCDVELVIHIVSDDATMNDILNNACNLTAIGRGEDFVSIEDISEVELVAPDNEGVVNREYLTYIPCKIIDDILLTGSDEGIPINGTRYLVNKDYSLNKGKREFNKIPVLCTTEYVFDNSAENVYVDNYNGNKFAVFLV